MLVIILSIWITSWWTGFTAELALCIIQSLTAIGRLVVSSVCFCYDTCMTVCIASTEISIEISFTMFHSATVFARTLACLCVIVTFAHYRAILAGSWTYAIAVCTNWTCRARSRADRSIECACWAPAASCCSCCRTVGTERALVAACKTGRRCICANRTGDTVRRVVVCAWWTWILSIWANGRQQH